MRNLKKVLAMALALVMSLSLVTIANAADFSDDADISYKEAVDVMSAIGVINGYEDGSFQPDGILTREEAAKLICTMLLGSGADRLGTTSSSFTDVAATRWSAPYIEYCNSLGIIAGNGDGTFDPTGELTGHAFAKMLLVALGYDSAREGYTGAGWSIEVAKDAISAGIDVDGVAMSAEVTREVAAQMAFSTLEATMVEYATAGSAVITPDGTQVITGGSTASKVENNASRAGYDGERDGFQQFCEEYFDDLTKDTGATDDYGRPANAWTYDRDSVGTYAKEADASYTEATEVGDIYADLGLDATVSKSDIDLFVDGVEDNSPDYDITRRGDDEYGAQGAQMDVYYDDEAEVVTICIVNTYLGIVVDDDYTRDGDDGILVQVYGDEDGSYFLKNGGYDQDTILLVQVADDEIQAVVGEPETVEVSLTRKGSGNSTDLVAGGTTYKQAAQFEETGDGDVLDAVTYASLDTDEDVSYTLYLDQYGNYIAAVLEDDASNDLVYVYDVEVGSVMDGSRVRYSAIATIVRMDGTVEELPIGGTFSDSNDAGNVVNDLESEFTSSFGEFGQLSYDASEDEYSLVNLDTSATAGNTDHYSVAVNEAADIEFEEGDNRVSLSSVTYYLNSDTSYLFITKDEDGNIDDVEVITGGINYKVAVDGEAAVGSSREVTAMVFEDSYSATNDNVIYFDNQNYRATESTGFVYRGYLLGEDDYTDFVIYSLDGDRLVRSNAGSDQVLASNVQLNGFYSYSERSNGSLSLTAVDTTNNDGFTVYDDNDDSYLESIKLGNIHNGVLTWGNPENSALVSNAVVVDLTDADVNTENTYGRNVSSVSTIQRLLNLTPAYNFTVDMYINSDNEVEAIFIQKIAGGNGVVDGGDDEDLSSDTEIVGIEITSSSAADLLVYTEDGSAADTMNADQIGAWLEGQGYSEVSFNGSAWSFKRGYTSYENVTISQKQVYDTAGVTWNSNVSRATTTGEGRYKSGDEVTVVLTRTEGTFQDSYTVSNVTGLGTGATGTATVSDNRTSVTIVFTVGSDFTGTDSWSFTMN